MEITSVRTIVLMTWFMSATSAPAGQGFISTRDTDKISDLRNKLQRLHDLLSTLDTNEETDLQSLASPKVNRSGPIMSEDMKEISAQTPPNRDAPKGQDDLLSSKQDEESILILSKALSRLQQPFSNSEGSTGDHLGTEYNEDDSKTEDMEKIITNALIKLNQEKTVNEKVKTHKNKIDSVVDTTQSKQDDKLRQEALKMVEDRLLQDLQLIQKFGFSLENILLDLQKQVSREKQLSDMESQLALLSKGNTV